jgi:hypothetical protein
LGDYATAVERYNAVRKLDDAAPGSGGFPKYVQNSLKKRVASETLIADSGTPQTDSVAAATGEEFDQFMADQSDESECPQFLCSSILQDAAAAPLPTHHGRNVVNCPPSQLAYLGNFVSNMKKAQKVAHISANVCTEEELLLKQSEPSRVIALLNADSDRLELDAKIRSLNIEQRRAFDAAQACVVGTDKQQMVMFLSGEGGTGKSHVIHTITKYVQLTKGKTEGWFGSVLKTAPTGGAAYNIRGHTWHSALGKTTFKKFTKKSQLSDVQVCSLQRNLKGVEFFILDEISLLSLEELFEISFRLCTATGTTIQNGFYCILNDLFCFIICRSV